MFKKSSEINTGLTASASTNIILYSALVVKLNKPVACPTTAASKVIGTSIVVPGAYNEVVSSCIAPSYMPGPVGTAFNTASAVGCVPIA